MVLIIGNQKGGAGKSTLTLLLANYLTLTKKHTVTVIDMDYQQSLAQKFEKAKVLENQEPYPVVAAGLEDYPGMQDVFRENAKDIFLIDLPGKLDDDGLIPVFKSANGIICPFAYDELSFESTVLFSVVLRQINPKAVISFIPNRVKANVRYETQQEVNEQLSKFGKVTEPLPDRIDFQRISTYQTPLSLNPIVAPVFEQLYQHHIQSKST
jgi:chromosome partitioning protein